MAIARTLSTSPGWPVGSSYGAGGKIPAINVDQGRAEGGSRSTQNDRRWAYLNWQAKRLGWDAMSQPSKDFLLSYEPLQPLIYDPENPRAGRSSLTGEAKYLPSSDDGQAWGYFTKEEADAPAWSSELVDPKTGKFYDLPNAKFDYDFNWLPNSAAPSNQATSAPASANPYPIQAGGPGGAYTDEPATPAFPQSRWPIQAGGSGGAYPEETSNEGFGAGWSWGGQNPRAASTSRPRDVISGFASTLGENTPYEGWRKDLRRSLKGKTPLDPSGKFNELAGNFQAYTGAGGSSRNQAYPGQNFTRGPALVTDEEWNRARR